MIRWADHALDTFRVKQVVIAISQSNFSVKRSVCCLPKSYPEHNESLLAFITDNQVDDSSTTMHT